MLSSQALFLLFLRFKRIVLIRGRKVLAASNEDFIRIKEKGIFPGRWFSRLATAWRPTPAAGRGDETSSRGNRWQSERTEWTGHGAAARGRTQSPEKRDRHGTQWQCEYFQTLDVFHRKDSVIISRLITRNSNCKADWSNPHRIKGIFVRWKTFQRPDI